jgi:plastocyanin domain-containing protein
MPIGLGHLNLRRREMSAVIVNLVGIGLIIFIIWFFWFPKKEGVKATLTGDVQEVQVTVKGGYSPDVIVVRAGKPVRLNFLRQESSSCTEMVVFGDFNKSAKLPEGEVVPVEFTPEKPGEYEFHCQMGMIRGKLIVE